jgi:hypothetical protein
MTSSHLLLGLPRGLFQKAGTRYYDPVSPPSYLHAQPITAFYSLLSLQYKMMYETTKVLSLCNAPIARLLNPLPVLPHASELRDLRFDSECVIVAATSLFIIIQMSSFPSLICHWLRIIHYWHLKPRKGNVTSAYVTFLFSFWCVGARDSIVG